MAAKISSKGYIPEELQLQAKKIESPVINELLIAAKKGQTQVVAECLARERGGAGLRQDPWANLDKHGRNCLQLACLYGHYDTVLAILQSKRLDINAANKRGLTALHDACTEGHTKVALLLLSMGASVTSLTKDGWSPLMCACSNGHLQLASVLIAVGSKMDISTAIGLTCLHIAAWKGQTDVVSMLVRAGVDVLAKSKNGKTALDLAREETQQECMEILQTAESKTSENGSASTTATEALQEEREFNKDVFAKMEKSKDEEIEKCHRKLKMLDDKVTELQALLKRSINSPPLLLETVPTPPANSKQPRIKELHQLAESSRSASYNNLTAIQDTASVKKSSKKLSPETATFQMPEKRRSIDSAIERRSITELVADSLQNPISMAAIRQELKADNLTPKIQRKLKKKISQTTLPSLNNSTSPTHRPDDTSGCSSPSPGNSPLMRPRWTHPKPALKDSAI